MGFRINKREEILLFVLLWLMLMMMTALMTKQKNASSMQKRNVSACVSLYVFLVVIVSVILLHPLKYF